MTLRFPRAALCAIAWFFLASVSIASIESFGFFSTRVSDASISLAAFLQLFSNTSGIMFIALTVTGVLVWFFMVWLGGVRPGLAIFFTIAFFVLFDHLLVTLEVALSYASRTSTYWATWTQYFLWFSLVVAALTSLILAKASRRFRSIGITLRIGAVPAILLVIASVSVWARNARFPEAPGALFWGGAAAIAIGAALIFWRAGNTPRRVALLLTVLAALTFAPVAAAYFGQSSPQRLEKISNESSRSIRHVLLITVDTLRQDSLAPYNANAANTPHIGQLARDSAVFTNAFSNSPWTYPSVASILTGLAPRVHQLVDGKIALPKNVPTLAEAMGNAGYWTGACGYNSLLLPRSRLNRGFDEYQFFPDTAFHVRNFEVGLAHNLLDWLGKQRPVATQLTDLAIQWFKDNAQRDSFFWIHYFDPHAPYQPPQEFLPGGDAQQRLGKVFSDVRGARMGSIARAPEERAWIRSLYDGEVRFVDAQIGRLLDVLRELGIYDETLILFTSDHGEEFWDHGHFEHGHTLYNELVRVPFLAKLPGGDANKSVDAYVSLQAIMPTVLDLCGVTAGAGATLLPPLSPLIRDTGHAYAEQPVFTGVSLFHDAMESVIFDRMKYIRMSPSGIELLFNLEKDPLERDSLAGRDPLNLEKGRQLLDEAQAADTRLTDHLGIHKGEKDFLNQEDVRSLQALGYL